MSANSAHECKMYAIDWQPYTSSQWSQLS